MVDLQAFPGEIFNTVIEHLVIAVGIQKAVILRTVNQAFDAAILQAICISQVVDIDDPATPRLASDMVPTLRGKIIAVKSHFADPASKSYLYVVAQVNRTLDNLISETREELLKSRHESIAAAVNLVDSGPIDAKLEAQNLLSGAAIIGDSSVIKSLLECDESSSASADVNGLTPYFHSPLTLAAGRGHFAIVCHLLEYGARLDSVAGDWHEDHNLTDQADWNNQSEAVRFLSLSREPPSALRAAVLGGHGDIVHLLLRPQFRLPTTNIEYLRAVLAGAEAGRLDLIEALFKAIGKDLSDFTGLGREMIWAAIRCDQKEVVQMLLNSGVDINAFPYPDMRRHHGTLQIAASLGNTSMVRFLIERGADVSLDTFNDRVGNLPIEGASLCGQEEVVQLLIGHGAEPVKAFLSAAEGGQPRVLKSLLSRFPDLPYREGGEIGQRAFYKAMFTSNLTAMAILVEAGVPLNDGYESSSALPLNIAKQVSGAWVIKYLISLGAQDTNKEAAASVSESTVRGVRVSERTWEWVSKY